MRVAVVIVEPTSLEDTPERLDLIVVGRIGRPVNDLDMCPGQALDLVPAGIVQNQHDTLVGPVSLAGGLGQALQE